MNDQVVELAHPGLQLIAYSPAAVDLLEEGGNYGRRFPDGRDLIDYVNESKIAAVGTRWPSRNHWLHLSSSMTGAVVRNASDHVRLGIEVTNGQLHIRGSDDLFEWSSRCPEEQIVSIDNGWYEMTVCLIVDDDAELVRIFIHVARVSARPELGYDVVPRLYGESLTW